MIPYNPSSFDRNKTILEQILELQKWLKQHPSYKVYYCTSNFMPTGDDDRAFSEIAGDPDEVANIAVGDIIVFPDAYYGEVIAVDYDNELATIGLPATSVKGPQGATGPAGADGTCIRKYNGNSNLNPSYLYPISNLNFSTGLQQYDLIYFNDGYAGFVSNVNVGLSSFQISARFYVNGVDGNDGAYVSNASVDGNGDLIITIYNPATSLTTQVNAGYVVGPQGPSNPEGTAVKSTGATAGQVLTADGSDGASWETPQSSGIEVVTITSNTGTFSVDDYNKLLNDNVIIDYVTSSIYHSLYKKTFESSTHIQFERMLQNKFISRITITKATRGYVSTDFKLRASAIDSETATNGQVLTADGNGGASWETPSGGSTLNVYKFSKQLNTDANRKQLYNIIDNAKSIKYIQDDDGKTYNIYAGLNQFRIIGFDAFASGVTKYVYILNINGTSTSGTAYNSDGTSSSISISGRSFECKYYNDSEITS